MRGLYLSRLDEYSRRRNKRCKNDRVVNRSFLLILLVSWLSLFTFIPVSAQGQEGTTGGFQPFNDVAKSLVSKYKYETNKQLEPYVVDNLREPGLQHRYYTGVADGTWPAPAYVEVTFDEPLKYDDAEDDDCLLIYVRRAEHSNSGDNTFDNSHPTAFRVTGFFENDTKEYNLFYVYLLYRGPYTQEYSSKVLVKKLWKYLKDANQDLDGDDTPDIGDLDDEVDIKKGLLKLRFYVTANNNREMGSKGYREMAMSRLDVLGLKKTADYSDTFKDRLHLKSDYLDLYSDYDFVNTKGIADEVVNQKIQGRGNGIWSVFDEDDTTALKNAGIDVKALNLPDLSFIQGGPDADPPLDSDQKRQRTHTVEHIIYAIPGDVVGLYPYYQMAENEHYYERFSHWYNYRTGKRYIYTAPWSGIEYDMLDFAIDPTNVVKSDKYGFITSEFFTRFKKISVSNVNEYIEAVNYANEHSSSCYIELTENLDFSGRTDVPMLGSDQNNPFNGFINGNGHTIKNLVYNLPDKVGVGLIGRSNNGVRVQNLIIDESCKFTGKYNVGLIGQHHGGNLRVENVITEATIIANWHADNSNEQNCGGIVGKSEANNNRFIIRNCYIGGVVGSNDDIQQSWESRCNGYITGWMGLWDVTASDDNGPRFENIVVNCTVYGLDGGQPYFRTHGERAEVSDVNNCYGPEAKTKFQTSENLANVVITGWTNGRPSVTAYIPEGEKKGGDTGDRKTGTFATFFCPRSPYQAAGAQESLPFEYMGDVEKREQELVIAADFAQEFYMNNDLEEGGDNVKPKEKKIYEPIIFTRHLFKIRDGKEFAEDFSGSPEKNENFVRKNQKMVSARAGEAFQIRFDSPVPKDVASRSNYYYKLGPDDYRRVCTMEIKVYDTQMNEIDNPGFYFGESFISQGSRSIGNVKYSLCGGGAEYYRMLMCDNPPVGDYIVRLIGKDVNEHTIHVYDDSENATETKDLVVMQYHITFQPEGVATIITEEELYNTDENKDNKNKYIYARPETLSDQFGDPDVIDFDAYMALNNLTDETLRNKFIHTKEWNNNATDDENQNNQIDKTKFQSTFFKWPLNWDLSNYSFGYNQRHDYNMYMLTTHSWETPFHSYVGNGKNDNANRNKNFEGNYGVFDRKYYDTLRKSKEKNNGEAQADEIEQGYFYYVNAATDPGVSARVMIDDLCPGSTVHVSAWMAEFSSHSESVNLSFNFVAVLKDDLDRDSEEVDEEGKKTVVDDGIKGGDRIVLHSFITGYAAKDLRGQWLNVYYSFVPRLTEFSSEGITAGMVDHYELELDNNAKSSDGADYAIDDIRVYVSRPEVLASQLSPICGGAAKIRVESPFHTLLQTCGEQETLESDKAVPVTLLYTFLNKSEYDETYNNADKSTAENERNAYKEAFEKALIRFDYDGRGDKVTDSEEGNTEYAYGVISFMTKLFDNNEYGKEEDEKLASWRVGEDGRDMIVFSSNVTDENLKAGSSYYVILATPDDYKSLIAGEEYLTFDMTNKCAKTCSFTVTSSDVIKIDGVIKEDNGQIVVCENQSPVIQLNIDAEDGTLDNGPEFSQMKNAIFDWYLGNNSDFSDKNVEGQEFTLAEALAAFREEYPNATDFSAAIDDFEKNEPTEGEFTKDMLKALMECDALRLYESSYLVPSTVLPENGEKGEVTVVAIPVAKDYENNNIVVCYEPTEITINVRNKSPLLRHGLTGIDYPMNDVPLRIGLDQLRTSNNGDTEFTMNIVEIPVREVKSDKANLYRVTESYEEVEGEKKEQLGVVVLVATDDAEYIDLGTVDKDNEDTGHLLWVGEVKKLTAVKGGTENLFNVQFDKDFKFKEGYSYSMRFQYSDVEGRGGNAGNGSTSEDEEEVICNGHDVFTLKIVPKYLVWTGSSEVTPNDLSKSDNLNWNNDANWSRVDSKELFATTEQSGTKYRHYVTDATVADGEGKVSDVNNRRKAFAPLDFTYVIIKGQDNKEADETIEIKGMPYLYAASKLSRINVLHSTLPLEWPEDPKATNNNYADYGYGPGDVTADIKYDMAAWSINTNEIGEDVATIGCRTWYMNTCKEIHFKPGSSIMNQQELKYEKAWVDIELDKQRWYTLSTPLQVAYAGDFYLPSKALGLGVAGGRQETELFMPINFEYDGGENGGYNRFKPAVYQRGWNKSFAKVYEIDNPGLDNYRNVIVRSNWSHVYNDVTEPYGGGTGFSISTDVSALGSGAPNKVLFRLPKADSEYDYYDADGTHTGHHTTLDGKNENLHHMLNVHEGTIKAVAAEGSEYFLVGNPFMTNMDIQKFLDKNQDKLENKYWLVTANSQIAGTFTDGNAVSTDNVDSGYDPTAVAPMQGFFVKAIKDKVTVDGVNSTIELNYDQSMMRRFASDGTTALPNTTRSGGNGLEAIRIVAENDGVVSSSALIATGYEPNSMKSVEAIDNRGLDIPSTVYTIGNGQALSINFCNDAEGVEIGLAADDDTETVIRFEGVQPGCDLSLLDKVDYSLTSLYDGMEIQLKGAAAGRYFLTRSTGIEEVYSGIEWSVEGNTLVVYDRSYSGSLDVKVYDTLGREAASESSNGDTIRVALPHGVYVVEITNASERKSAKIRL